jgi:NitT/TauT family transport system substrate-binding protein
MLDPTIHLQIFSEKTTKKEAIMAKKVYIQPGVWIVLIVIGLVGVFFGIQALKKNGGLNKVVNAVAPASGGNSTTAPDIKVAKVEGQKPLVVAVNTWVGYAGIVYYNGGLDATATSRFYTEQGVPVQILIMDDFAASRNAWKASKVDVITNTADVIPTEIEGLGSFEPKIFNQVDWSRGGDKVLVRPGINTIADLKGKTVAVAPGTPSQTLIIRAIESGEVAYSDLVIKPMGTAADAANAFKAGQVDVAIVWSPDDEDCLAAVKGSKVLISTAQAKYCIADVFYAKAEVIKERRKAILGFTAGMLKAATELNKNPTARQQAQKLMAKYFNVPEAVMNLDNARFTTYGDNESFFNLLPTQCSQCVKGEDLYTKMAREFNKIGLAPASVPPWRNITDISILSELKDKFSGTDDIAEEGTTFTKPTESMKKAPAIATKRVTINFTTGSSTLSDEARYIIDQQFIPIAKGFAGYRVRIEGNTDNVGSASNNKALSMRRAKAVATYLTNQHQFDGNRFIIVGNGPDKPVADNDSDAGRATNRRTDFELISGE